MIDHSTGWASWDEVMNMTQKQRALSAVRRMSNNILDGDILSELEDVIAEAQNSPPLGAADGSIDPVAWNEFRDLAESARMTQQLLLDVLPPDDIRRL